MITSLFDLGDRVATIAKTLYDRANLGASVDIELKLYIVDSN